MGKDQELLQAVKSEDVPAVQKLLQRPKQGKAKLLGSAKRVNVNYQDLDGFSALHHAALNGNSELISLLIESQATVDIKDNKAMRPLHYAAWQGKAEPMKMLLKAASSVNSQSEEGQIPLHLAAQHGHYEVSEMLLQHQSNPCIVDIAGKTPLDLACEFGRVGVVQLLLSSNMCAALLEAKPGDITDPNGTSPLHLAAKNGHIDIIRLLLQAGIDINRQTKAGTALHEAALCGKTDVVRLLLESGVNAHIKNTYNQTALDIVHQFTATQASKEIKQMLRDASAALQVRAVKDYCNNYDLTSLNVKTGDVITISFCNVWESGLPAAQNYSINSKKAAPSQLVLEQHPDGRWKGCIHDNRTGNDRVGYFPSSIAEVINKRSGSWNAVSHAHSSQQYHKIQLTAYGTAIVNGDSTHHFNSLLPPPPPPPFHHQPLFSSFGYHRTSSNIEELPHGQGSRGSESSPSHLSPVQPTTTASEEIWVLRKPFAGGDRSNPGSTGSVASARSSGSGQSAGTTTAASEGNKLLQVVLSQKGSAPETAGGDGTAKSEQTAGVVRPQSAASCPVAEQPYGESQLKKADALLEAKNDLMEWLSIIGLAQYYKTLVENGYENIEFITDITWEDLQEIGITKLGHQKKFMLAVKKLAEIQRASRYDSGTLKKKKAPQSLEIVAIESPQGENAECQSPKMSTFQDSELSSELQVAMTSASEAKDPRQASNHGPPAPEGPGPGQERDGGPKAKPHGTAAAAGSHLQRAALSQSQESVEGPGHRAGFANQPLDPGKRAHRPGGQRASGPPAQGKPRGPLSTFTPPPPPPGPGSPPPLLSVPQATAKVKPIPQLRPPERPMSPRSPPHRGFAYVTPQPAEGAPAVPELRLPPPAAPQDPARPKKRAHSLSRAAASDGEPERDELTVPEAGPYATVQRRVARSHSARAPAADAGVNRSQSFALRPRKKGPPPPPPKRSSSAISSTHLADGLRRPEDEDEEEEEEGGGGGAVETGSAGSVRSIAAMLELSSIGGGAHALSLRRSFKARKLVEGEEPPPPPPAGAGGAGLAGAGLAVATPLAAVKRGAIGLDGEVINRRRTISGPVTGLIAAARRDKPEACKQGLPFAEEGHLTIKPRSRPPPDPFEVRRAKVRGGREGPAFHLVESSTVKRRAKGRGAESPPPPDDDAFRRRPASDLAEADTYPSFLAVGDLPRRNSEQPVNGEARRPVKPPVSPKPCISQPARRPGPPPPAARKSPLPGPASPEVKHGPAPLSPKPILPPPLTPPKPIKPHIILQSLSAGPTPVPSPAKQPTIKAASTPASLCSSPAKPIVAGPPQQVPVKPPRSSISGPSTEMATTDVAQMKLEETSASLAAALQAVEEKIKHEEGQKTEFCGNEAWTVLSLTRISSEVKSTGSILDDIGSMFDDLADQLDAMLE
ncbi:caskin-1 isoform X7 [Narcine bancroftii]|uniref:caskin-1 isoform X7 n=1 Tax=Narcine bancroftii TaxID=1343680 RepID=UPI003831229A